MQAPEQQALILLRLGMLHILKAKDRWQRVLLPDHTEQKRLQSGTMRLAMAVIQSRWVPSPMLPEVTE
ncbi:hypothetical protein EWJ82_10090 [Salmonella enterica subsp. enterica serovar Weybridge]|nr:hypothetical protein [Salmonella enterica subsp. enterica serovar Weybridge]